MKYTIRSTSEEGVYYLVNGWNKAKTFWIEEAKVSKYPDYYREWFFSKPSTAKASPTKLLKVMPDYLTDTFELVEF